MSVSLLTIIVFSVMVVLGIGLVGVFFYLCFREEEDYKPGDIIINCMSHYGIPTKGYGIGKIISIKKIDNRYLVDYKPLDVDPAKLKAKEVPDKITVPIGVGKLIPFLISDYRKVWLAQAPNAEDYSPDFKASPLGQAVMKMTEDINAENTVVDVLRNKIKVEDKLLHLTEGEGRVEEFVSTNNELNKDLVKNLMDIKTSTKSTQYQVPISQQ